MCIKSSRIDANDIKPSASHKTVSCTEADMKLSVVILIFAVLIAGAFARSDGTPIADCTVVGNMANKLINRYNDDRIKCNGTRPAYECSGILIRGVREIHNRLPYAWSLKTGNKERNSFSAAFLRKDTRFIRFPRGYDSGFIIYPHSLTPPKKNKYKVLCAFPVDAHTDDREDRGCGQSRSDQQIGSSKPCDKQEITSITKWIPYYERTTRGTDRSFVVMQCGFNMTKRETAAEDFATLLNATAHLRNKSAKFSLRNNELLFSGWNANKPENIPIEAFFYLLDTPGALEKAEMYQTDYYKLTGEVVPVVGIRLPTDSIRPSLTIHSECIDSFFLKLAGLAADDKRFVQTTTITSYHDNN